MTPKEHKKHSRTSLDLQFKKFSLTKQNLHLEWTINRLEKQFRKIPTNKLYKAKSIGKCEKIVTEKANFF